MATKPTPPPPFVVAHMAKTAFHVLRLKNGQAPGGAPAYVFECTARSEAVADRICKGLTFMDAEARS